MVSWLSDIAIWCDGHQGAIAFINALVSGVGGGSILWLRREALAQERWARWFGWALVVLAIQYVFTLLLSPGPLRVAFVTVLSTMDNLLLFVAGILLLGGRWRMLRRVVYAACGALALWALIVGLMELSDPRSQAADALLSVYVIVVLGLGLVRGIRSRRHPWWTLFAWTVVGLYVVLHLLWLADLLIPGGYLAWFASDGATVATPKQTMHLYQAVAIVLKAGLAFTAARILLKELVTLAPRVAQETLQAVCRGQTAFLSRDGVVQAIGRTVDADRVRLCILLPRRDPAQSLTLRHTWCRDKEAGSPVRLRLQDLDDELARRAMETGREVRGGALVGDGAELDVDLADGPKAAVVVPIFYHGEVIGCLRADWDRGSETAIGRVARLAEYVAPAVEAVRTKEAIRACVARLKQRELELEHAGAELMLTMAEAAVEATREVLGQTRVHAVLNVGFRASQSLADVSHSARSRPSIVLRADLNVGELRVGVLRFEAPKADGVAARGLVFPDQNDADTIASVIADAVLDAARVDLADALERMQPELAARQPLSRGEWAAVVCAAAQQAGCAWAAVRDSRGDIHGQEEPARAALARDPERGQGGRMRWFELEAAVDGATVAVVVPSTDVQGLALVLGVARRGFGPELALQSPWRVFLDRLLDLASATYVRMTSSLELLRLQQEASQQQVVYGMANLMSHELGNRVNAAGMCTRSLKAAVASKELRGEAKHLETINDLTTTCVALNEMVAKIFAKAPARPAERPRCDLGEAAARTLAVYGGAAKAQGVLLSSSVSKGLCVGVPDAVVDLALSNLLSNALDALRPRQRGSIHVGAQVDGGTVQCSVRDDGPGMPADLRNGERLFEIGATTKPGSGGWGLPLVRSELWRWKATLTLPQTGAAGTLFIIHFPSCP